jgi:hypothetical protein
VFGRTRCERESFFDGLVRGLASGIVHRRRIVVRTGGERDAPMRHRQLRIEFSGTTKRAHGLVMIKRIDEDQPLIKERLRLRVRGRDGVMMRAETGQEHDRARARRSRRVMLRV